MATAKKKFYAVRNGRETGVFESWDECNRQVKGFANAVFKAFPTLAEAEAYLKPEQEAVLPEETLTAYVDGSYIAGRIGYGAVLLENGQEIHLKGRVWDERLFSMHNVAGEMEGAKAAMSYALEQGSPALIIYHDYEGVEAWCTGGWAAKLEGTKAYRDYYLSIKDKLRVEFRKVKGHSGDHYNDLADELAKAAILRPET